MLMAKRKKGEYRRKPPDPNNPWPKQLKALRDRLDVTQVEAAKRADVATVTWIAWEHNQRTPSKAMQKLLVQIFPEIVL